MTRTLLALIFLFQFTAGKGGEMRIQKTSGGYDPSPIPIEAFFNTELEIQLSISGPPEELKGKRVLFALFQRIGERVLPLGDPVQGGVVEQSDSGELYTKLLIPVPEFSGRTRLAIKVQIEGAKLGEVIDFAAVPDDMLSEMAARQVLVSGAVPLGEAFAKRGLDCTVTSLEELGQRDWSGLWFASTSEGAWNSTTAPSFLNADQYLILLKDDDETMPLPIASQRGEGWLLQFPRSWFDGFSTNAGTQSYVLKTINLISNQ